MTAKKGGLGRGLGRGLDAMISDTSKPRFNGYIAGEAPIYLIPYHPDVIKNSNGVLTNGYGFGQE